MIEAIPRTAFFRFELTIPYWSQPSGVDAAIDKWPRECLAPALGTLEGKQPFADVYWAWNEDYFLIACEVIRRTAPPRCDPKAWWKLDGLRVLIDTRDARDVKRATRFCHFFYALPVGGGKAGRAPIVGVHGVSRAKENPPDIDVQQIQVATQISRQRYALELAIPAGCLHGWSPLEHPRIGVYYKIRDTCHGDQQLCASDELGWNSDPSIWATGVLKR